MADYVKALKNYRRQLASNQPAVEAPSAPSSGFMSNTRRQLAAQTPETQPEYNPSEYVNNGLRALIAQRESFTRQMESQMATPQEEGGFATGLLQGATASIENKKAAKAQKEAEAKAAADAKKATEKTGGLMGRRFKGTNPSHNDGGDYYASSNVVSDTGFVDKVKAIAAKYNTTPEELMSVMHFETGGSFSPSQRNAAGSSATGLIQFLSSTAEGLGTSTEALANMDRIEQLDYVDKYLAGTPIKNLGAVSGEDLYMAVFHPASVGKESDAVLFEQGSRAYEMNKGLDSEGKGYITKADASRKALRYVSAYRGI